MPSSSTKWNGLRRTRMRQKLPHDRIQRLRKLCGNISAPPKEGTRRWLKARLDQLTAQIVKVRDGHRCVICGSAFMIDCGHIYTRGHLPTRWDIQPNGNCHAQCRDCNTRHINRPEIYLLWYQDKFSPEELSALHDRAYSDQEFSNEELSIMVSEYEEILEQVRADALCEAIA